MFDVIHVEKGNYFIRTLVYDKIAKFNYNLITIYGDAQVERKLGFLAELARVYHDNPLPSLVGGDCNIITKSCEKNKQILLVIGALFSMSLLNMPDLGRCL